ncbi:MAG TPA: hypothetical protein GX505_01300 [Clostridiales bacterium]|nr:hypothetical protein [Clostridiales bacterium]
MKRKTFILILVIEAVLCTVLSIMKADFSEGLAVVMAFPFEQVGILLRSLSLSGTIGNIIAIVIYTAICLAPAAIFFTLKKRRRLYFGDGLLILMSAVLFVVQYLMINPGYISSFFGKAIELNISRAVLGGSVYSLICSYFVLRILDLFFDSGTKKLQKYMIILLCLLNVLFVYMFFGSSFSNLLNSIVSLRAQNIGNEHLLGVTYVFLVLQFIVDALPYILDIFVVFASLDLLDEISADFYSYESVKSAGRLSHICRITLVATVLTNTAFNLIQLIFAKRLMVINNSVHIPFLSVIFVLAVLILARYIEENKKLKDYNDMFI